MRMIINQECFSNHLQALRKSPLVLLAAAYFVVKVWRAAKKMYLCRGNTIKLKGDKKEFPQQKKAGVLSVFLLRPEMHEKPCPREPKCAPTPGSAPAQSPHPIRRKQSTKEKDIMAYMTQEGYDKMVAQLRKMETIDRPAASAAIAEARDKGDLSENSEYDAAKEAQGMLEMKISNLKAAIADAKIIDPAMLRTDVVQILSTVEMRNTKTDMVMKYTIVSESEANLREGKISSTTPIAQGLLGKKVGDVVDVKIPQGTISLEILNISIN